MDISLILVVCVVIIAVVFDFTNGFHDAANAIATAISTRAWAPRAALAMAAVMNLVGSLLGTEVAKTIGSGIIDMSGYATAVSHAERAHGLLIILGGLIGAICWNVITWYFGLPSSSSHALIGGLAGAGLAAGVTVNWATITSHVLIPMVVSPLIGFTFAYVLMSLVMVSMKNLAYRRTMRKFRVGQKFSSAALALGHGLQDAQKTMGVIFIALVASGHVDLDDPIPLWVKLAAATAIAAGTFVGGFRIMKTLGSRVIHVDPANGFVSETVAAGVLYFTAFIWHAPISTTHTVTTAIMGVGATRRLSAVRWGTAGNIVVAWVLTLPAAAAVAAAVYTLLEFLFRI